MEVLTDVDPAITDILENDLDLLDHEDELRFQQNGSSFCENSNRILNYRFPGKGISRGGPLNDQLNL